MVYDTPNVHIDMKPMLRVHAHLKKMLREHDSITIPPLIL